MARRLSLRPVELQHVEQQHRYQRTRADRRRFSGARQSQPDAQHADVRLEPDRVQPHSAAIRVGQIAARTHRQSVVRAIHLQHGRAWRAQVLERCGEYDMGTWLKFCIAGIALLAAAPAGAALNIFACTPEWGALSKEIGGDKANVYVATTALQDPHRVEARPSLIARARSAHLVVCTGAELEIGWLPLVQSQSGNPKLQAGRPGLFEASRFVTMLEVPRELDRAQGDVHPAGNPHLHLDPRNIAKV